MEDQSTRLLMQLARDWLLQYSRFQALEPELLEPLRQSGGEFTEIPIPAALLRLMRTPEAPRPEIVSAAEDQSRALLNSVASSHGVATSTTGPAPGAAPGLSRTRASTDGEIWAFLRDLLRALEAGEVERVMAHFSPDCRAGNHRGLKDVGGAISSVLSGTESRSAMLLGLEILSDAGAEVLASAMVAWEASGPQVEERLGGEQMRVLLRLLRKDSGGWLVMELSTS